MKLFAWIMLKIIPKAKPLPDYTKHAGENQYDYQVRVPLNKQPTQENAKLNYLGEERRT